LTQSQRYTETDIKQNQHLTHVRALNPFAIYKYIGAIVAVATVCTLLNSALATNNKPINLSITTHLGDEQTFREGDIVSFYVSLEKDAYLVIVYQDASDQLNVLLPNALHANNYFKAGWFVPIPNEQNPFQFRITAPFGKETLWVFASDKPVPPPTLPTTVASVRETIKKHCRQHNAVYEEASLSITTTAIPHTP
jgi:hypothetical protein